MKEIKFHIDVVAKFLELKSGSMRFKGCDGETYYTAIKQDDYIIITFEDDEPCVDEAKAYYGY